MYKILLTCPPMMNRVHIYSELFKKYNFDVFCPTFTQVMKEDELCNLVPKFDAWIIGDDPATEKVFKAGKEGKLKAVVKWGVGTDNVDFKACKQLNIPVTNIPGVFGEEVSDVAVGYLLCLSRKLHEIHNGNLNNKWLKPIGETLVNKKVCIIGLGDIGRCIARKLLAFKLNIWASDPMFLKKNNKIQAKHSNENDVDLFDGIHTINIDTLENCLNKANFIIISCPLNKHTYHLINKENILKCKKRVKIINVARGSIVNEKDVIELLENGFIDSVGFDVFEEEPFTMNNNLFKFKQNIFGSHNGSNTVEAVDKVSKIAIKKLHEFLQI